MSWIPFYAVESDFGPIIERLNRDRELAIILPAGRGRWTARVHVPELADGKYILWHIRGGPLPLMSGPVRANGDIIADPFSGWTEPHTGPDPSAPYFGSIPYIFEFRKATRGREFAGSIGVSSLGWIGTRYKDLGIKPSLDTENWWIRLARWVKWHAKQRIPRSDSATPPRADFRVFPAAYERIQAGTPRDAKSHL